MASKMKVKTEREKDGKVKRKKPSVRSSRKSLFKAFTKKKAHRDPERGDDANAGSNDRQSNFPCCFYIPLDIAMQGLAFIDIVYYSCYALLWAIFLALEPFAGKDEKLALENLKNSTDPNSPIHVNVNKARLVGLGEAALNELLARSRSHSRTSYDDDEDENLDLNTFKETTTTFASIPHNTVDRMNEARLYSRIARRFQEYGQEIDDGCGRQYYAEFLYSYQLDITRALFEEVAKKVILASLIYAVVGCILLTTICCFRGYIASKMLIIFMWYVQLVPNYLILRTAAKSQSQRFCILQYGFGKGVKGQGVLLWSLLWPLISYKPYQAFIWANYIRRYFRNKEGKLFDESYFSAAKLEERTQKLFQTNPFIDKSDFTNHRRALARAKLFQHPHKRHVDHDLDKSGNPTKIGLVDQASSSD